MKSIRADINSKAEALVAELLEKFGPEDTEADAASVEKDERLMTPDELRAKRRKEFLARLKKTSLFPGRQLVGVKESNELTKFLADFQQMLKNLKYEANEMSNITLNAKNFNGATVTDKETTALRFSRVAKHLECALNEFSQINPD